MSKAHNAILGPLPGDIWYHIIMELLQHQHARDGDDALSPHQWALLRQWSRDKDTQVLCPPVDNAYSMSSTISHALILRSQTLGTASTSSNPPDLVLATLVNLASLNATFRSLVASAFRWKDMSKTVFAFPATPLACACHSTPTVNNRLTVPLELSPFIARLELEQNTCLALSQAAASPWTQYKTPCALPALKSLTYRFFGAFSFADAAAEHAIHLPRRGNLALCDDYLPCNVPHLTELRIIRSWDVDVVSCAAVNTFFRRDMSLRPTLFEAARLDFVGPFHAAESEQEVKSVFRSDIPPCPFYCPPAWTWTASRWARPNDINVYCHIEVNDFAMVKRRSGSH